jgi:20S proteasome alpha/beta subunit
MLSERVAGFMQVYTLYSHIRPFGASVIVGTVEDGKPLLYMLEPSGVSWGYHGVAVGKGRQAAKTELEKLKLSDMSCREAIKAIAKMYVPMVRWGRAGLWTSPPLISSQLFGLWCSASTRSTTT